MKPRLWHLAALNAGIVFGCLARGLAEIIWRAAPPRKR